MKKFLMYLWQLPQNIVALVMYPFMGKKKIIDSRYGTNAYEADNMSGGISLGNYIYVSNYSADNPKTVNHEFGHVKQSHMLGWLYLIVIGIPSILWAASRSVFPCIRKKYSYYDFYTEKWADKLGGVIR